MRFLTLALLATVLVPSCTSKWSPYIRTMSALRAAGVATGNVIHAGAKVRDRECSKGLAMLKDKCIAKGSKEEDTDPVCVTKRTAERTQYAACMGRWPEAIKHWAQIAGPALNSALLAGLGALDTAMKLDSDGKAVWSALQNGFCSLKEIPKQWKDLLGSRVIQIDAALQAIGGVFQCP